MHWLQPFLRKLKANRRDMISMVFLSIFGNHAFSSLACKCLIPEYCLYRNSQSYSGYGCRPGRIWIFDELKKSFPFTYIPKNQPNHEQFPIDWTMGTPQSRLTRAVFVGSKIPLLNDNLTPELLTTQRRIG